MVKNDSSCYTLTRRCLIKAASTFSMLQFFPSKSIFAKSIPTLLIAARIWPSKEYTRITLESDKKIEATQFIPSSSDQLVLNIKNLNIREPKFLFKSKRTDDPYISKIHLVLKRQPDLVQIVFDLKKPVSSQIFSLQPTGNYQYRFIVDFYPRLIEKRPTDLEAQKDHLGDFIQSILHDRNFLRKNWKTTESTYSEIKTIDFESINKKERKKDTISIVLDPGHGGEDPGAIGKTGLFEKDVVLQIGKYLNQLINKQKSMKAYLTRDEDYFVPLDMRVQKARKIKADLLISIHANACTKPSINGSSVFALSQSGASSNHARWLADRENSSDLIGGANLNEKDRILLKVLMDLATSAQIRDSLKVGTAFLHELSKINKLHKNNVEQASFSILRAPDIPSILVETAFISNPKEEAMLKSENYQKKLATAMFSGIKSHFCTN